MPLSRLKPVNVDKSTTRAIEECHYRSTRGTASDLRTSPKTYGETAQANALPIYLPTIRLCGGHLDVFGVVGGDPVGNLINYELREGTYIIPKVMDNGYVELGKKRMEFSRKG